MSRATTRLLCDRLYRATPTVLSKVVDQRALWPEVLNHSSQPVRLSLSVKSTNHSAVFFAHNKYFLMCSTTTCWLARFTILRCLSTPIWRWQRRKWTKTTWTKGRHCPFDFKGSVGLPSLWYMSSRDDHPICMDYKLNKHYIFFRMNLSHAL